MCEGIPQRLDEILDAYASENARAQLGASGNEEGTLDADKDLEQAVVMAAGYLRDAAELLEEGAQARCPLSCAKALSHVEQVAAINLKALTAVMASKGVRLVSHRPPAEGDGGISEN